MITLSTSGSSIVFEFSGNSTYLNDGTIAVPQNSLALIIDESDMVSFKKANSNDLFVSANISEFGMTKDELISWYETNMVGSTGGGGVTTGEVQTQIDNSISGKVDTTTYTAYTAATDTVLSNKQTTLTAGTGISIVDNVISAEGGGSITVDQTIDRTSENPISNKAISNKATDGEGNVVNTGGRYKWEFYSVGGYSTKQGFYLDTINGDTVVRKYSTTRNLSLVETSAITTSITSSSTDAQVPSAKAVYDALGSAGGGVTTGEVQTMIDESISGKTDDSAFTAHTADTSIHLTTGDVQTQIDNSISGKVDTTTYTAYTSATDTALAGKQTTLTAGTGIDITDNVISATGGGGKAIEAGRGISITTGETADTVSISLPISAGTGNGSLIIGDNGGGDSYRSVASGKGAVVFPSRNLYGKNYAMSESSFAHGNGCSAGTCSHAEGFNTKCAGGFNSHSEGENTEARGTNSHSEGGHTLAGGTYEEENCHAEGYYTSAMTNYSHAEGYYTYTSNNSEHSQGRYNVSNKANTTWGDSGNTLFSVGNGTSTSARHNAFEIRQNGDIYFFDGTNDVKLQDVISNILNRLTTIENNS